MILSVQYSILQKTSRQCYDGPMTLHDTIKDWMRTTLGLEPAVDFALEYPGDPSHGDFAANIALVMAKREGKIPRELAADYVERLSTVLLPQISKLEVAGPGFINVTLSPAVFADAVKKILKVGPTFGELTRLSGERMIIEYTQPNPFKEFHIGHLMNNIIGESISRIVEAHGTEVIRATYHGDVGLHVAKAVWGLRSMDVGTDMDVKTLGKAYALGASLFETDEDVKKEIVEINKKLYQKSDDELNTLYDAGFRISIRYFEKMYERLGSHFDHHFYESQSGPIGTALVEEYLGRGVFVKSDNAVIFPGENYALHTRVFLSSEGLPTYEAKELGLMRLKRDLFSPFDLSLTITANEQDSFFKVVFCAMEHVFPEMKGKLKHLSHGMMKLPSGKMSSRTGDVVTAESMIDMVKEAARHKTHERILSDAQRETISEMVAIAALKFSILRQSIGGDIVFDLDKALSLEGDSGPYLQYAAVRAQTILRKATGIVTASSELPHDWQPTYLERLLERYPRIVARSGREYAPHHIVTYLVELAGAFNSFYANHKIIDAEDTTAPYKLALTAAFADVITSGLHLLGISVPPEM